MYRKEVAFPAAFERRFFVVFSVLALELVALVDVFFFIGTFKMFFVTIGSAPIEQGMMPLNLLGLDRLDVLGDELGDIVDLAE